MCGRPSILFTDNGTNFQGAYKAVKQLYWDKIGEYSTIKRIEWKFNPPAHHCLIQTIVKRLIRLLKQLLCKVLGKACLNYEDLLTALCSCESVINSRPLTYISEYSNDMTILTPAMFLNVNTSNVLER